MKRSARRITMLLLLLMAGAIVNVAVAWSASLFVDVRSDPAPRIGGMNAHNERWELLGMRRFGIAWFQSARSRGTFELLPIDFQTVPSEIAPSWGGMADSWSELLDVDMDKTDGSAQHHRAVMGCGWPTLALWCQIYNEIGATQTMAVEGCRGAIDIGLPAWDGSTEWCPRVLPYRPIWPGFAINTIFYAAVLAGGWMLFAIPFALRKRRRIKRGLCPKCAYDLRAMPADSNACPECGASVPPPSRAGVRGRVEHAS